MPSLNAAEASSAPPNRRRNIPRLSLAQRILGYGGITLAAVALFLLIRIDITLPAYWRYIAGPAIIANYFKSAAIPKLQIGAGPHNLEGWLNTDIEPETNQAYLDASKHFDLPDASVRYVFGEQVIEHLTYEQGGVMLKESHRVLAPGGKIRIATPNLANLVGFFEEPKHPGAQAYLERQGRLYTVPVYLEPETFTLNRLMHDYGHKFIYTPKLLRISLERAGFHDVKEFQAGQSDDPALANIDYRTKWEENALETIILQATR